MHSPTALARRAGQVQFLGEMPWEAGRLRSSPTRAMLRELEAKVKTHEERAGHAFG
jgi:hypothetical protein